MSRPVSSRTSRAMLKMRVDQAVRKILGLEGAGGEIDAAGIDRMRGPCGSRSAHCRSSPASDARRRARPWRRGPCASRGRSSSGPRGSGRRAGRQRSRTPTAARPCRRRAPAWRRSRAASSRRSPRSLSRSNGCGDGIEPTSTSSTGRMTPRGSVEAHCMVLRQCRASRRPDNGPTPWADPSRCADSARPPGPAERSCARAGRRGRCRAPPWRCAAPAPATAGCSRAGTDAAPAARACGRASSGRAPAAARRCSRKSRPASSTSRLDCASSTASNL